MVLVLSGLGRGMSGEENEVSLRVAKAIPSDVGHGRARISGEHGLDLKPGDIVEIKGEKRSTAAIYWRSRPEDSKMDICLLYTSPSPRDATTSRMPSSA